MSPKGKIRLTTRQRWGHCLKLPTLRGPKGFSFNIWKCVCDNLIPIALVILSVQLKYTINQNHRGPNMTSALLHNLVTLSFRVEISF